MTLTYQPLTNAAYGFPRGQERRIDPKVLAVVHITANMADAQAQRDYANRAGSDGPSAHYYIDRDGDGIRAIDETRFAAWSNGDLKVPNVANAGVRYLVDLRANGHNANEGCYLEIEAVGTATVAGQYTEAQFETIAAIIAAASMRTGIEINRETVITHGCINSIDRANCAFLRPTRETQLTRLITLAKGKVDMVEPLPITSEVRQEITVRKGTQLYDLDGVTKLGTPFTADLDWRDSPYSVIPGWHAMYATVAGKRRLGLVKPGTIGTNTTAIRNLEPPDCAEEVAAAIVADRAKARIVYP